MGSLPTFCQRVALVAFFLVRLKALEHRGNKCSLEWAPVKLTEMMMGSENNAI